MRRILIGVSAILMSAALLAPPVSAAGADQLLQKISQLDQRVDQAKESGAISNRDASRLERQVDQIADLHISYERGGFTRSELRLLDQRIAKVGQQLATTTAADA